MISIVAVPCELIVFTSLLVPIYLTDIDYIAENPGLGIRVIAQYEKKRQTNMNEAKVKSESTIV